MPKKIHELVKELTKAGWQLQKGGKGSHRKFAHAKVARKLILSGQDGVDAKRYQEVDVRQAVKEAKEAT